MTGPEHEKFNDRIGNLETDQARLEEKMKTAFNLLETYHDDMEKHHAETNTKLDTIVANQQSILALKNRWLGMFFGIAVMAGMILGFTNLASNILKWFN